MPLPAQAPPKHASRRRRNYLLNPQFQIKYTGLLVLVVFGVGLVLGVVLWRTSSIASDEAQNAVTQAEIAFKESATSARIIRMSAAAYGNDAPDLGRTIEQDLAEVDRKSERNLAEVAARRASVEELRKRMLFLLVGGGLTLVIVLGVLGIFITHRIVGPVHRMKRLCRQVGTSRLSIREGLRRGDELEDLFDTFVQMTYSLKALQTGRLASLDAAMEKAQEESVSAEVMSRLKTLRAQLCLGLTEAENLHRPSMIPPPKASQSGDKSTT
jgi:nitrogen fixation/metabolism regulation signal transduction histidine kinase